MVLSHYITGTLYSCNCCLAKYHGLPPKPGRDVETKDFCRRCTEAYIQFLAALIAPSLVKGPR